MSPPFGWGDPVAARVWAWLEARGLDPEEHPDVTVAAIGLPAEGAATLDAHVEVRTEAEQVLVHVEAPWEVPPDRWDAVAGVIARLNFALPVGNLELNRAGDLHCRTSVDLEGVELDDRSFDELMESLVEAGRVVLLDALQPIAATIDGDDPGFLP